MATKDAFMVPISIIEAGAAIRTAKAADATAANPLGGSNRLFQLLTRLEKLIEEKYAFDVFAKDSINFGIMVTYRQKWEPQKYQVGDLVKTIPLAPKEIRRYTTRAVTKKTRAVKELEDNLQTRKSESSDTSRVDEEIVEKAQEKTHFNLTANETFGGDGFSVALGQSGGGDSSKESARIKKDIRERNRHEEPHDSAGQLKTSSPTRPLKKDYGFDSL